MCQPRIACPTTYDGSGGGSFCAVAGGFKTATLDEEQFLFNVEELRDDGFFNKFTTTPSSGDGHPGLPGGVNFDRREPGRFNAKRPPSLTHTQLAHLQRMRKEPSRSWYRWRLMPIWEASGKRRVVFGAESLLRTATDDTCPWMDLVQLQDPRNHDVYILWKLGEIRSARAAVLRHPCLRRVFVNITANDLLDERFNAALLEAKDLRGIVLELDEAKNHWPESPGGVSRALQRVRMLRQRGVRFAIDDVGENRTIDNKFLRDHATDFDYVKFSYSQCVAAFVPRKGDAACKRRRRELDRIMSTYKLCRKYNDSIKFVIEFSLTREHLARVEKWFPVKVLDSSDWLIQGGATEDRSFPAGAFAVAESESNVKGSDEKRDNPETPTKQAPLASRHRGISWERAA